MRAIGIEAASVTKRFGAFTALSDVSLKIAPGTVHALLGENGAGKSTIVKCLLGYYRADEGGFIVDGKEVAIEAPADADRLGLGMVYQHFTLVPSMTAAENLVMARADVPSVIAWRRERERLAAFLATMPFKVPIDVAVGTLAAGERQKLEILKQLYLDRRLIVLDEPTSTLTPAEAEEVLGVVRGMVDEGRLTTIIITHKLKEVDAFADEVSVLRRGRMVGGGRVADLDHAAMTKLMIGESHEPAGMPKHGAAEPVPRLVVSGLATIGDVGHPGLSIESLEVRPREIVGIAGVSGNGQKDLVEVLGGQRKATAGEIRISAKPYHARRDEAQALKVRVLPEEPLRNACVPGMSVRDNLNLRRFDRDDAGRPRALLDGKRMAAFAAEAIAGYGIRAPSELAPIRALSGGNVQRAVLARELDGDVDLLIVANPCFGLDVKAVAEIRARIVEARNGGAAVLLVSEDLDEILELADRVVVMREGRIVYEAEAGAADAHVIGGHMVGHS
ncbi:ABC transporter ATP-binding protein [Segnochrobactrum spirostomi]|uniref:ATP-binding cassette domain-containing protein n=1 Tax=Segnochrobactrum spirostomi TaxID=2608987 RepID=A0A6A7Y5U7_9HYPH|nr:ATP-binding cassette domain-containing protein [Segnochrobactrum spirostomi]MQT14613.1 ATP-binding cassette domain-containing protein [Segnochrobactrum spirostomi]